jgi:hypothetical protein
MDILPKDGIEIIVENNNNDSQNTNLIAEEYTQQSETLLKYWMKEAKELSNKHNIKGKNFKWKHELVGIPAMIIPIIASPISGLLADEPGIEIFNVVALISSGVLSGIYSFFNFSRKSELHFRYEANYQDLYTTILVELSKKRELRYKADRFIEQIQSKIDGYATNAPLL